MTKEELKQEAYEYAIKEIPFIECITQNDLEILVQQAYITGAEPREKRIEEFEKENAELDCQKNRNKFCYSCANATERCFRNEIGCPCEKYKSWKEENAELEKACEETQELLDKQIEATYKLDKENTELRDNYEQYKAVAEPEIKSLKEENAELKKMYHETDEDNNKLRENIPLLAEAKELLKRLLITSCNSDVLNLLPNCSEVLRVRVEAEQFLNSEVEK